jgi:hypothetical protein
MEITCTSPARGLSSTPVVRSSAATIGSFRNSLCMVCARSKRPMAAVAVFSPVSYMLVRGNE